MYGLPYHNPSILNLGNVIRYSSFSPEGRFTLRTACPICFTIMLPPAKSIRHQNFCHDDRAKYGKEDGVPTAETCLLRIVSSQEPLVFILNAIGGDWRVMGDLLDK